jgi:hypothetical protein
MRELESILWNTWFHRSDAASIPLSLSRAVTSLREILGRLVEETVVGPARLEGLRRAFTLDVRETDHEYIVVAAICNCSDLTLGSCRSRPPGHALDSHDHHRRTESQTEAWLLPEA